MSRIDEIFLLARDTLNDHQKQRWSDDTLMRNLRLAIQDIAKQAHLFKEVASLTLRNGIGVYNLRDGTLRLSHVAYNKQQIPLVSSGWMAANRELDWRATGIDLANGDLEFAVYDEVKRKELAVYPRPFGDFLDIYTSSPNNYGLVSGISDFSQLTPYGLVADIQGTDVDTDTQTSYYGVISVLTEEEALIVYYTECPELPYALDDELIIDECFDSALKFYITGMALRNDVDAANRNMASEEFVLYERDLAVIVDLASTDSVSAPWFESHYNSLG